ncbi:MAG: phosphate/phosphite/phosphonate ABC transporter substrate-binding protein [Deltaproteobacteria bacterium]|nr:phosphate/phosphite/phosphonate ABC transporter substrate-binding protein [Deltaproteobacteria bacterium]
MSRDGEPSAEIDGTATFGLGPAGMGPARRAARSAFRWVLAGATGRPSRVHVFDSYSELLDELEGLAFAWLPPATYVRAQSRMPLTIVRGIQRGTETQYRSVLFTRDVEGVRDLTSLRDARVAWVDRDSCSGHLFPRLALRSTGLHPHEVFAEELFLGSHSAVVHAVGRGFADVGASYMRVDEKGEPQSQSFVQDGERYRVLLVSEPIPADVVVAGPIASAREVVSMRRALRGLTRNDEGREVMRGIFDADDFVEAAPADYRVVRDALAAMLE